MNLTKFFKTDFCDYSAYDNYRKIACYVDGLKPSARKTIYTILKNNIKNPMKVSQLLSLTAQSTNYLHGESSIFGVVVGLAQDFVGSNNIPLLKREGNFGSRLIQEPSAGRYIFTCKEDNLDLLFNPLDNSILIEQEFEGDIIEPRFYVPTLPLILVNGSKGISTGFAQLILPRDPKEIIHYIKNSLEGKENRNKLLPYYKGFTGEVRQIEKDSFEILGKLEVINTSTVKITELPVEFDLQSYTSHLNKLEDNGEISSYSDCSNNDKFLFEVKLRREKLAELNTDKNKLYDFFKLIRRTTENYTVLDENLKIKTFTDIFELLNAYIKIRKEYYQKRKDHYLSVFKNDLLLLISKYEFINGVVTNKIHVNKVAYDSIVKQLEKNKNIIKKDGAYDYLLQMAIHTLTKEKLAQLIDQIKSKKNELKELSHKKIEDLWLEDLRKVI